MAPADPNRLESTRPIDPFGTRWMSASNRTFDTPIPLGYVWITPLWSRKVEFVEWTADDHLRHAAFVGLREDKNPTQVVREADR
jgi:ATP-dependent DNA ligase